VSIRPAGPLTLSVPAGVARDVPVRAATVRMRAGPGLTDVHRRALGVGEGRSGRTHAEVPPARLTARTSQSRVVQPRREAGAWRCAAILLLRSEVVERGANQRAIAARREGVVARKLLGGATQPFLRHPATGTRRGRWPCRRREDAGVRVIADQTVVAPPVAAGAHAAFVAIGRPASRADGQGPEGEGQEGGTGEPTVPGQRHGGPWRHRVGPISRTTTSHARASCSGRAGVAVTLRADRGRGPTCRVTSPLTCGRARA
jgi:hypothetical protein